MYTKMGKYYCTYAPDHPRSTKEGYVYTHLLVAEEKLGRYLTKEEVVHHLDENKLNNHPDNLIVFATKADHAAFHHGGALIKTGDVYKSTRKTILDPETQTKKEICPICGGLMTYGANSCDMCRRLKLRKAVRPTKEKLLELIKTTSFLQIGRMYGVSDNAIRKWCKSYDLPYKQKDIQNYQLANG